MSTSQVVAQTLELPEGVSARFEGRLLTVKGPKGTVKKNFDRINVHIKIEGNKTLITSFTEKKKDAIVSNTVLSLIRNMITGVTKGYEFKLKIVYAHFPISVKIKGNEIHVENFVGERSPRIAKILGDCKVTTEGDDIIVKGPSHEDVAQTAANVELATKIKRKDQRVFLDGVYVYEKNVGGG
ncbi:MAG: 50S ribosomal protein L6 [Thaumarchaeota archaeon]|nr:50S ribosomal protein L6 [Nitrososphaerota archaeon]